MRPSLQPLLQTTILRWGTRPRPRHAFQIQQYLVYGNKRDEEKFSYRSIHKELLRSQRFPRKYEPIHSRIWWTMKRTPRLLKRLIVIGVQYPSWRKQNPRTPEEESVVAKSRIGRFIFDFVTHDFELFKLLNKAIEPWGVFAIPTGASMQPTFSGNPEISYSSYAYIETRDVSIGDVVAVLNPEYGAGIEVLVKRIAALEGDRIWVAKGKIGVPEIIRIPPGYCFILGDNHKKSRDSRKFGVLPIEAISVKNRWRCGYDGFQWDFHNRQPWLESRVIVHLAPGQNRPTPPINQPQKKPVAVQRPKVKHPPQPQPSPSPPK